jgi:two-component system sensor histidine kinase CpxA
LHRAIENILRNAIRYTEPGSEIEINLGAAPDHDDQDDQVAVLEVSDRGPGIPEAELNAIFLPFYRVDNARSPHTGGSGVGLAIAVRAVKLHGGELNAFNRPGGGATIRMRLPVHSSNGAKAAPGSVQAIA